jgi:alkenylglycerophosphocholine/alkenylglycerophosphoethanolamine hydrolase
VPFHRDVEGSLRHLLQAAAVGAALVHLIALTSGPPALRLVAKPVPVLCLAVMVLRGGSPYARWVGAGLVLSAAGDVFLEFPRRFLFGLCAFLLAHLLYLAAFVRRSRAVRLGRLLPFLAWTTATLGYLWPGLGSMRGSVTGYVAVITAMMWRASAAGGSAAWGAVLFGLSDTLIALDRFGSPIAGVRYPIILLYWAGQAGIAASALSGPAPPAGAAPRVPAPRPPAASRPTG